MLTAWPVTLHNSLYDHVHRHTPMSFTHEVGFTPTFFTFVCMLGGWSTRRSDLWLICDLDPGNWRLLSQTLSLERAFCLPSRLPKAAPRTQPSDSDVLLDALDGMCDCLYLIFQDWAGGRRAMVLLLHPGQPRQ